jgi:hypothetical protein
MAKKPGTLSRRDFLRDAALAAGAVGVASMLPPGAAGLVATAHAQEAKIGAQLIGKLEGPELVLDATKWPKKFAEAPMLADLVKQGKLPPVDKRVPDEPMVVKPLQGIGRRMVQGAPRLHGPGRRRERQPHRLHGQDPLLGLHRDEDHALCCARVEAERRRQVRHHLAAQGHEVVGRCAVHRR